MSIYKAESKFHEGKWVVNNTTLNSCHVLKVEHGQYICNDCSFPTTKENEYHLWTIQDAKEGDVLFDNYTNTVFIFKSQTCGRVKVYCDFWINKNKFTGTSPDDYGRVSEMDIQPAIKEQQNLLFQKIHEAGYEWDAEKKELKKIEQSPAWSEEDEYFIDGIIETEHYMLDVVNGVKEFSVGDKYIKEECTKELKWAERLKENILGSRVNLS